MKLRWKKFTLLLIAATLVVGGTRFGLPLWRMRRANFLELKQPFALFIAPDKAARVLILAPHCDDETLACGGLISQALQAGAQVKVVLVTNGDGFRYAAARWFEEIKVSPQDYRRFAVDRRQESLAALATLGLPKAQVISLGYPDGGTAQMWLDFWSPENPFTSPYTKEKRNPYPDTFHPGASYCGQVLTEDLKRIIQQYQPTLIFCPHPNDDHPDHWVLYAYTLGALYESGLLGKVELQAYLVHRGDWPLPQGLHPNRVLSPPAALVGLGDKWESLPLKTDRRWQKLTAIRHYQSQLRVMRRFLYSFVRANELFAAPARPTLPQAKVLPKPRGGGEEINWSALPPILSEPVQDQALSEVYPAADIARVSAIKSADRLFLRLDLWKPASRKLTYTIYLHPLEQQTVAAPRKYQLRLGQSVAGADFRAAGRRLEISLPWGKSWQGVMLGAISQKGKRVLNKTAWVLLLPEAPQADN
jgi:LmbE family N-acetylglucosaminyl deacetylase